MHRAAPRLLLTAFLALGAAHAAAQTAPLLQAAYQPVDGRPNVDDLVVTNPYTSTAIAYIIDLSSAQKANAEIVLPYYDWAYFFPAPDPNVASHMVAATTQDLPREGVPIRPGKSVARRFAVLPALNQLPPVVFAVLYADGASAGDPPYIALLQDERKAVLDEINSAIALLKAAQSDSGVALAALQSQCAAQKTEIETRMNAAITATPGFRKPLKPKTGPDGPWNDQVFDQMANSFADPTADRDATIAADLVTLTRWQHQLAPAPPK